MDSDEALYAKLVAGQVAAFDRLYERYEQPLFGFVLAQLGERAEAEDVCHEAFLAVLRARRDHTQLASFRAWLFQVARNLVLNRVRSRKRAEHAITSLSEVVRHEPAPVADEIDADSTAALHGAVQRLPAPLAEVYTLRSRGLSYEELATVLDIPVGTVKSRMHEMVKRLREEMTR